MKVTVLGSGTSTGVPTLGCRCSVCQSSDPHNKRLRASAYVEAAGKRVLLDCGTDFRTQALACGIEDVDFVLVTHTHADHINGLDDLRAFNMVHHHRVDVFGKPDALEGIRMRFAYCFTPAPPGGGIPELNLVPINGEFSAGDIQIVPVPVLHGGLEILGFRIGSFAYLTDVSHIPEESYGLLGNLDVLISTALRLRPHPTHMCLEQALAAAGRIGARRTYFTHMNHDMDHAAIEAGLPPGIRLAYDGLVIDIA